MCCFTNPLTWGERTWLPSSLKPDELSENIYLSVLLNLEVSWNQFPFFFQIAHRLGKILLGAFVPELPHLEGQTMSCKVKILLVKSYSILLCNVTKQFSHLSCRCSKFPSLPCISPFLSSGIDLLNPRSAFWQQSNIAHTRLSTGMSHPTTIRRLLEQVKTTNWAYVPLIKSKKISIFHRMAGRAQTHQRAVKML